jgi:hypothetical protein
MGHTNILIEGLNFRNQNYKPVVHGEVRPPPRANFLPFKFRAPDSKRFSNYQRKCCEGHNI